MKIGPVHRMHPEIADPGDDLAGFCVLVPYMRNIEPETEELLDALERKGLDVYRRRGSSDIAYVRSEMASMAVNRRYSALLFLDSDMLASTSSVLKILRRPEPVVAGGYVQKEYLTRDGKRKVNFKPAGNPGEIRYFAEGGDYEVTGVGAGFLRIRTEALKKMAEGLPLITAHGGEPFWPFFKQEVVLERDGRWGWRGEDYAFCEMCRSHGIPVILDTTIRLFHIGGWWYGMEEAYWGAPKRLNSLTTLAAKNDDLPIGAGSPPHGLHASAPGDAEAAGVQPGLDP